MRFPSLSAIVSRLRRRGIGATCTYGLHRVHDALWERRMRVRTAGEHLLAQEGLASPDRHDYSPASVLDFERVLRSLTRDERRGGFVDLGAGKGRILLRAACEPFAFAIGVEVSPRLVQAAERNLAAAAPRLRCRDVRVVLADATAFALPDATRVLFFYNPFGGETLATVLADVRRSLARAPRPFALVAVTPERIEDALADADWIAKVDEFRGLRRTVVYRPTAAVRTGEKAGPARHDAERAEPARSPAPAFVRRAGPPATASDTNPA